MTNLVTCPTCIGTGEVHSHNPRCWDCSGSGKVTAKEAKRINQLSAAIDKLVPRRTGDYE